MGSETGDGGPTTGRPAGARCLRCNRSGRRCFCARLPEISNRTLVRILQHPREQRHRAGTAPFVTGSLRHCQLVVANDSAGRIAADMQWGVGCALLYPGEDSVDLATLDAAEHPSELLLIDGTWSQAKRLFHDNPWLAELPKVHLDPARPSRYLVRHEPRADYLSTVESTIEALGVVEPELCDSLARLREVFEAVMREQHGLMTAPDRSPRMQRPRQRESRAVPDVFLDEPCWVVHTEQIWCQGDGDRVLRPVHWSALEVGSGAAFEAVLRPTAGDPDLVHLGHVGIRPAEIASAGRTAEEALASFRELAGAAPLLCAWSRLPLRVLRALGLGPSRELLLKVLCANLRGDVAGGPEAACRRLGIEPHRPDFRGRGAARIGAVWALARWVRERGCGLRAH